jgi:hypothetical protein
MFIAKIHLSTAKLREERHKTAGCFPCRSYGAWINLLAQVYKQVAPNGAFNPPLCSSAFQQGHVIPVFTRVPSEENAAVALRKPAITTKVKILFIRRSCLARTGSSGPDHYQAVQHACGSWSPAPRVRRSRALHVACGGTSSTRVAC